MSSGIQNQPNGNSWKTTWCIFVADLKTVSWPLSSPSLVDVYQMDFTLSVLLLNKVLACFMFFFLKKIYFYVCWPVCMYVSHMSDWCPRRLQKGTRSLRKAARVVVKPHVCTGQQNTGNLKEQHRFLPTEIFLLPRVVWF